jgi:hypothetical protein
MTALVVVLEVIVLTLVRREDDVASGDEEPLGISALGNEEAGGTLSPRRNRLTRDLWGSLRQWSLPDTSDKGILGLECLPERCNLV